MALNHRKQILRVSHTNFLALIVQFVVVPHGLRDLSNLPWLGGAAVHIFEKKEAIPSADMIKHKTNKYHTLLASWYNMSLFNRYELSATYDFSAHHCLFEIVSSFSHIFLLYR